MKTLAGLDYDERGAGEVVCLVHAGAFSAWFAPLFDEPALDGFRVIRPIRPGYGDSPAPSEPASLAAQARPCGELLRRLGVHHAYWVGHSSSCCIGLQLALDDPDVVAGLVLFEPAKPSGPLREVAARAYVAPALAAAAPRRRRHRVRRVPTWRRRRRLQGGYPGTARNAGLADAERESAYFFADEMPALAAWTFGPAEATRVAAPALLLHGGETRPWFRENVEILAAMLPKARTEMLPGLDHVAPLMRPAEIASAIAQFVGHRAPTAT